MTDDVQNPSSKRRLRVVLVDDHRLFRDGLALLVEQHGHEVVGHAATAREGVRVAHDQSPDVVVLDLGLPGEPGLDVIAELRTVAPVLVMSGSVSEGDVVGALRKGASGYVVKEAAIDEMVAALETVARGGSVISQLAAGTVVEHFRGAPEGAVVDARREPPPDLGVSARELDVLRLVVQGRDNGEIAAALAISVGTVKSDISSLLEALGVENRVQLAVEAVRRGVLQ